MRHGHVSISKVYFTKTKKGYDDDDDDDDDDEWKRNVNCSGLSVLMR